MNRDNENPFNEVRLDLSNEIALARQRHVRLIDRLDLLLTYGNMSGQMRQILISGRSSRITGPCRPRDAGRLPHRHFPRVRGRSVNEWEFFG